MGVSADGNVGTDVGVVMGVVGVVGVVVSPVATVLELEGSLMPPPASAGWVVTARAKSPIMASIAAILCGDRMVQQCERVNIGE